LLAKYSPETRA
jgi:large subunit ribosomal protein L7Ae